MMRQICSAALALTGALLVSGCDFDRGIFAAPKKEYLLDFCGTELLIPKSYFVGQPDLTSAHTLEHMLVSWPDMTGWGGRGLQSRVSMLVGEEDCERPYSQTIEFLFEGYKEGDLPLGQLRPPAKEAGAFEGFQHFVRPHTEEEMVVGAFSETDIFIRRDGEALGAALVICPGRPIKPSRSPQCEMYVQNSRMPSISVKINFDRNKQLQEVREIETAVSDQFRDFEAAAAVVKAAGEL